MIYSFQPLPNYIFGDAAVSESLMLRFIEVKTGPVAGVLELERLIS